MSDLDFILQKTKALKEARDAASQGKWHVVPGDSYCAYPSVYCGKKNYIFEDHEGHEPGNCPARCEGGYPPTDHDANFTALAANESTRFADALEVVVKALKDYEDMGGFIAEEAIAQAAGILRGESDESGQILDLR